MRLEYLSVQSFRNFERLSFTPDSRVNLIYGENGSGKTSLLEALHYLAYGRSFRTSQLNRLIAADAASFQLVAKVLDGQQGFTLGVERTRGGDQRIRMAGEDVSSFAEVATLLPLQFIDTDSHRSFASGPKYRRKFLDWGLFHVKLEFLPVWRQYQRLLKQRNAALKVTPSQAALKVWDERLIEQGERLDRLRQAFVGEFSTVFYALWQEMMPDVGELVIKYHSGWGEGLGFAEALANAWQRDQLHGCTHAGPHRGDLKIRVAGVPVWDRLSQGQQKVMCYALRLAQGVLLNTQADKQCIYLVDDLPAELDAERRHQVANKLLEQGGQVFITGVSCQDLEGLLPNAQKTLFEVQSLGEFV